MPKGFASLVGMGQGGTEASPAGARYRVYGAVVRLNALVIVAVIHAAAFALALYGWQQSVGAGARENIVAVALVPLTQDKPRQRQVTGSPHRDRQPQLAPPVLRPLVPSPEIASVLAVAVPVSSPIDGGREDRLALTTRVYREALMARLEAQRRYPREQLRAGHGGQGMLLFRIDRDGRLIEARVESSTGRRALDRAALAIVQGAAPFPGIPPELPDELAITLPITFLVAAGETETLVVGR